MGTVTALMSTTTAPPPSEMEAEQSVLGAVLLSEDAWDLVGDMLEESHFFTKRHRAIWAAMLVAVRDHGRADGTTVLSVLRKRKKLEEAGGAKYLSMLVSSVPSPTGARTYAGMVLQAAHQRHLIRRFQEGLAQAHSGVNPAPMLERLMDEVRTYDTGDGTVEGLVDAYEFADTQPARPEWLIEPLIARKGRVILYAEEGGGKSLLSLQVAAQAASGMPVLGRFHTPPLKCLYVDLEQADYDIVERVRQLRITIRQQGGEPHNLMLIRRPDGIDGTSTSGQGEIERALSQVRPDILVIDPLYKLCFGDMNKEQEVKPILLFLDRMRRYYDCGIWLVHHPRKSPDPTIRRGSMSSDLFGSAVLLRWTEALFVIPEQKDCLFVQKLRHHHKDLKKGDEINFRRGGRWFFEATDGPVMTDLHREVMKILRQNGPTRTAPLRELAHCRKERLLACLRDLEAMDLVKYAQQVGGEQTWELK